MERKRDADKLFKESAGREKQLLNKAKDTYL